MTSEAAPCRLFVYQALEAPLAVVLRRGPSEWARLSLWHTDSDRFEHGQWLRGRVYERRCDISADGSLFVAFIRKSDAGSAARSGTDSWVALSRPPWFTALAVWLVGGTYYTGGFFPARDAMWLGFREQAPEVGATPSWLRLRDPSEIPYRDGTNEWPDRTVHFNRLLRDGWRRLEDAPRRTKWERPHPSDGRRLVMIQKLEDDSVYGGPYVVEYGLMDEESPVEQPLGIATWADWDARGRLILARDGRLVERRRDGVEVEVADFNGQAPESEPAPALARTWPRARR